MRYALSLAMALVGLASVHADEKPVEIPLKDVWAYLMPGTRDVVKLDDGRARGYLVAPIQQTLRRRDSSEKAAEPGFAVEGSGLEALRNFYEVRVKGEEVSKRFSTEKEISIAFFSYRFSQYVHLHQIERRGNEIVVEYRFEPHAVQELTTHLAIIPLGELPAGKYQVAVVNVPMADEFIKRRSKAAPDAIARQIVCGSFDFVVTDPNTNR